MGLYSWGALMTALAFMSQAPVGGTSDRSPPDLAPLSLEQLMDIRVVTAAKRGQKVSEAAVAVYVITQEDIRRSGAITLAEALRMAPGVSVASIDSNKWAVSARGFRGRFANKLLVLVDGRSVYTPLFSGTHWDVQDMLLEDVDRIEVIRGPGATLWGANAVNGVVNVITSPARDTQGGLAVGGAGSRETVLAGGRYGFRMGESGHARVYGKYFDREGFLEETTGSTADDWHVARGGFRLDRDRGDRGGFTLQGDVYDGRAAGQEPFAVLFPPFVRIAPDRAEFSGGNLLGRFRRSRGGRDLVVQAYYDRSRRRDVIHGETRNTWDLDVQQRVPWGTKAEIVWGLGYRRTSDALQGGVLGFPDPPRRQDDLLSGFVQGETDLGSPALRLIVGSKVERNDYSGLEVQPSVRLLWTRSERTRLWASVSRAVRTPSRFEDDTQAAALGAVPTPQGVVLTVLTGSRDFDSETLLAWEAGLRTAPSPRLYVDLALFHHVYGRLRTFEPGPPFFELDPAPPHLVVPVRPANLAHGEISGLEAAASWSPVRRWKLNLAGALLRPRLHASPESRDPVAEREETLTPRHQMHVRSYVDLTSTLRVDGALYYAGGLSGVDVPAHARLDLRLAWQATSSVEVVGMAQDLLEARHREAAPDIAAVPTSIPRRLYTRITWRF